MKAGKIVRRMTRRSFRRKLIMFGASIFASVAITATGFATWVLSADASHNSEGGIDVASVSDASISIESIAFLDKNGDDPITNFKFEPVANDKSGRVKVDDNGNSEDMDIRIGWTVKNYQHVESSFVEFKIPEGVYNAIEKGYLALPESVAPQTVEGGDPKTEVIDSVTYYVYKISAPAITANGNLEDNVLAWTVTETGAIKDVRFTLTLKFLWGETFGNVNPSEYYDNTVQGLAVSLEEVKETLIDLKATIFGISESDKQALMTKTAAEQDAYYSTKTAPSYKVVIHATVK